MTTKLVVKNPTGYKVYWDGATDYDVCGPQGQEMGHTKTYKGAKDQVKAFEIADRKAKLALKIAA